MKTETVELAGDTDTAVLEELARHALEAGYVEEAYVDALLDRERDYPTGLRIERDPDPYGVAIPHADPDHVREQAVLVGLPESTATFRSMDDADREIEVDVVVLLLVTETEGYSAFLSNLTKLFQDDDFARLVLEKDGPALAALIADRAVP